MKKNFRYDSRYLSKKKENIQELVEYILNCDYGTIVPLDLCASTLQYNIEDEDELKKFKSTMARVREFLIDYGYILKSITNTGYYILKPSQASSHCYRTYIKSSRRTINKSKYVMEHIKYGLLNDERLEEYNNFLEMNNNIINELSKTIENSKYYNRKEYYDSLED